MMFKKYLPTSLFGRTFLIVMVPVLLLQIMVSIVFFDRHWSKMTERLAFAVTGEMLSTIEKIKGHGDLIVLKNNLNDYLSLDFSIKYNTQISPHISSADFRIFPNKPPFNWNAKDSIYNELSDQINDATDLIYKITVKSYEKTVVVEFQVVDDVVMFLIPEGRLFSSSSYIFILWMIGLSLLLFTIAMIFMRNQIRPIYRLGIIAERLGRGIPVGKIKPSGAREVRQAAEAFTQMQDRINQYISGRTTMLAGVSHDLRTPLTRMKLQLEMMDDGADKDALRSDIIDMERMIEGYLSFAKGDGGEDMQRINLKDILDKMIDDAGRLNLKIDDKRQGLDDRMIWAKPVALSRALDNFVSNAARYADKVMIDMQSDDEFIRLNIHDNGDGIADDKITEVMKPFVRGEDSRNKKTGGVGLGLTIANDIIIAHGGTLTLSQSETLSGLKVSIQLPL